MFSAIYETDASSAVSHSAFGRFLPGNGRQLVTVCLKTLRIYRFNPHAHYIDSEDHNWKDGLKLECIYRVDLLTPVKSLEVARLPSRPDVDSLVLAFEQAKVSIVYFDSAKFALETTSLHDFDDEPLKDGFKTEQTSPKICIDPQQRCAAILLYGRHLAILPFNDSQAIQSYTISLKKVDSKLDNIIDISFLHGYYEPTLLIVYEPIQTTPGRASIRYDTVSLLAVSLNVKDRVHAVIWNVGGLPTTIHSCLSFPIPVGGACLFGANEVIYLNQAVPPCGLALNSDVDDFTRFPFATEMKTLRLTLDGCVIELLNENEVLIATRNGELYLLSLNVDISNAVKQMRIQKIFDVTTPFTLTSCYPGYVFLGSKLADSLLLHYERQTMQQENGSQTDKSQEHDVQMDEDDLYLYSTEPKVAKKIPATSKSVTLKISIVDRFMNTAPCKVLRVANANDVQAEFSNDSKDVFFDLVSAAGNGRDSSMCFFQRTVRPFVQTCIEAENALELFKIDKRREGLQKYLIAAMDMSTNVYELKSNTVDPLDSLIFATQETTILIGELKSGEFIVQVTPMNIVLIGPNGYRVDERITTVNLNTNFPVTAASIIDPYIALLTQNGRLLLYKTNYDTESPLHQVSTNDLAGSSGEKAAITTISIYKDLSGLAQLCDLDKIILNGSNNDTNTRVKVEPGEQTKDEFDDIDALLYGNDDKPKQSVISPTVDTAMDIELDDKPEEIPESAGSDVLNPTEVVPRYFLLIVRENGSFYIHDLNTLELVYRVKKLNDLSEMLVHTPISEGELDNAGSEATSTQQQEFSTKFGNIGLKAEDTIMEIRINGLGLNSARPVLSVMIDDVVWFYEMFVFNDGIKGSLMVRFRRLDLSVITRSTRFMGPHGKLPVEATRDVRRRSFIIPYNRVGDLSNGLFITGNYPSFLVSAHGEFILHPFVIDGSILSCYEFDRPDCQNGFIYLKAGDSVVRTAYLNSEIRYDHSYPVKRICFGETVRFVVFLLRWNLFALITCKSVSHNKLCIVTNEDKQMETHDRDENYALPEMDQFKLQLFSTFDWNFIPNSAIEFDEFETVTCCEEVLLSSESTLWGLQSYLAVGTALNYGEEVFVRGRILIYEVIDVVPEEGLPTTRHKLKCVYDKEQKGPVTSMCHCNGFLLTGMGQKVFIWQFRDGLLNGVSFLDTHFYVHNLVGFRSLALACDMFRSVSLLRYQDDHKVLSLVSKDLRAFTPSPMSSQFLLDRNHLFFVLSDENGNISIFSYLPEAVESHGGENLVLLGSLNIGSPSNGIVRVNGHAKGPFLDAIDTIQETQTNIICTLDGSWSVLRPINERAFRRLQILQQLMVSQVPQSAGLNPRACRAAKPQKLMQQAKTSNKAIIDGNFVFQFMNLSSSTKSELARASGSNRYQIMDDITEFRRACTHL